MVKGIEVFKRHFASNTHQFVLIGGAACDLLHEEAGLQFRATKDLDIVLCIETLDVSFVKRFRAAQGLETTMASNIAEILKG